VVGSALPDTPGPGTITVMTRPPDSVKAALQQRLDTHQRARWPQLTRVQVRSRGDYASIDADEDGDLDCACGLHLGDPTAWTDGPLKD
jgi:hypothetical protein